MSSCSRGRIGGYSCVPDGAFIRQVVGDVDRGVPESTSQFPWQLRCNGFPCSGRLSLGCLFSYLFLDGRTNTALDRTRGQSATGYKYRAKGSRSYRCLWRRVGGRNEILAKARGGVDGCRAGDTRGSRRIEADTRTNGDS